MSVAIVCCECGRSALVSEPEPRAIFRELHWFSSCVEDRKTNERSIRPLCDACAPKVYTKDELKFARKALRGRREGT